MYPEVTKTNTRIEVPSALAMGQPEGTSCMHRSNHQRAAFFRCKPARRGNAEQPLAARGSAPDEDHDADVAFDSRSRHRARGRHSARYHAPSAALATRASSIWRIVRARSSTW
jgi:hypothetical protein